MRHQPCKIEVIDYYREQGDPAVNINATAPSDTSTFLSRFPVSEFMKLPMRNEKGIQRRGRGWEAMQEICRFVHNKLGGVRVGDTILHICPDGAMALCVVAPSTYWHADNPSRELNCPFGLKLILTGKNYT